MKADKIMNAIGNVDDRYITEAMEYKVKKKPIWLFKAAVAACLCIAILGEGLAIASMASELRTYKKYEDDAPLATGVDTIDQKDNPAQIAKRSYARVGSLTSEKGVDLTVTTDKTRYTVDEFIYVTVRVDNVSDVFCKFYVTNERFGIFNVSSFHEEDIFTGLYDTSRNPYDIDANSEIYQIELAPGEYYSQEFRFSAKYISRQPDWKPIEAKETLPLGVYYLEFLLWPNISTAGNLRIAVEIVDTPSS